MPQIVVIRDYLGSVDLLGQLLAEEGWDVATHANSRGTLRRLRGGNQGLIILDVLGRTSGATWDLLTLLYLDPELKDTPVIVCSPVSDDLLAREEWLHHHEVSVLRKPFELGELQETIEGLLEQRTIP